MMQNTKRIRNIVIVAGVILAVALILMLIGNKMEGNAVKTNQDLQNYSDWLSDNCACLEHNRPYCLEGFKLNGKLCFNEQNKTYESRILGCSKYNCSAGIKTFNNITGGWEGN